MSHPSHKLKAWTGDAFKPLVFCENCGQEETEASIHLPCAKTFYEKKVDTITLRPHTKFVSGLQ